MIRIIAFSLAVAACSMPAPAEPPAFDPLDFFTGPSRGVGTLKIMTKPSVSIHVSSNGSPDGKGGLVLDQTIREGTKAKRQRRWVLRPTSPTTLSGTITDNPGRVRGRIEGDRMILNYTMKGGMKAEQVMTLQAGGRSLVNRMTVRKFGVAVAHVDEVITKVN